MRIFRDATVAEAAIGWTAFGVVALVAAFFAHATWEYVVCGIAAAFYLLMGASFARDWKRGQRTFR